MSKKPSTEKVCLQKLSKAELIKLAKHKKISATISERKTKSAIVERFSFLIGMLEDDERKGFWKLGSDKCPKCQTNLEFRGREKKTLKFRYCHYELFCPKCGEITCIEQTKFDRHVSNASTHAILASHAGEIGEKFAKKFLLDADYEIKRFAELASYALCNDTSNGFERSDKILNDGIARLFLRDKYESFIKFCEAWNKDADIPSKINHKYYFDYRDKEKEEETFPKGTHVAGLDFVGKKDGEFYLIEVKTNKAILTKYQKKMLLRAKDFGFVPLIIRVKVELRVPLDEVRIQELR